MRLDLALNLKVGDIVLNCFLDKLVITSRFDDMNNQKIILSTIDTRLKRETYSFDNIYLVDFDGESDEEISWIDWAKNNRDLLVNENDFDTLKQCYVQGFGNGYQHKKKFLTEEMLQK